MIEWEEDKPIDSTKQERDIFAWDQPDELV